MATRRLPLSLLFVAVVVLFCGGLVLLAKARFESGSTYPACSSYSREPRGSRVLFDALDSLKGMDVSRNVLPLASGADLSDGVLFMAGFSIDSFVRLENDPARFLEEWVKNGNRLVITFASRGKPDKAARRSGPKAAENPEKATEDRGAGDRAKAESPGRVSADSRERTNQGPSPVWAIGFDSVSETGGSATLDNGEAHLPATVEWPGIGAFAPANGDWRTIYRKDGKPVVVERRLGKGTIVLASDSFFLTNEAMKGKRSSLFLAWLTGGHRRVVFDETHLGIVEKTTIMTLIERNGLIPFLLSLLVAGILVAWKQAVPLLPVRGGRAGGVAEAADNRPSAMAGLFRRNIPGDRIVTVCLDEWEKSFTGRRSDHGTLVGEARRIVAEEDARPRRQRNAWAAYNRITGILAGSRTGASDATKTEQPEIGRPA